ncbi:uncharacterized protein J3R85_016202 [Psidium guajava]|nr:uncharacterized protein J3R85_016202 [Psidium guajava]
MGAFKYPSFIRAYKPCWSEIKVITALLERILGGN